MVTYQDYLTPEIGRQVCDRRIHALTVEGYTHQVVRQGHLAIGDEEAAANYAIAIDQVNKALTVIAAERTRWEESTDAQPQ